PPLSTLYIPILFFMPSCTTRDLHSFPTRRSSDLITIGFHFCTTKRKPIHYARLHSFENSICLSICSGNTSNLLEIFSLLYELCGKLLITSSLFKCNNLSTKLSLHSLHGFLKNLIHAAFTNS